eukprot:364801-Chlamydomonas_euryale.AAC.9
MFSHIFTPALTVARVLAHTSCAKLATPSRCRMPAGRQHPQRRRCARASVAPLHLDSERHASRGRGRGCTEVRLSSLPPQPLAWARPRAAAAAEVAAEAMAAAAVAGCVPPAVWQRRRQRAALGPLACRVSRGRQAGRRAEQERRGRPCFH